MKLHKALLFFVISAICSTAYGQVSKPEIELVFQETLKKARNAISHATNTWSYDNTNQDYFSKDTIVINTARAYRRNYCKEIRWSFYENQKLVLENIPECTEPPSMLKLKKEDYLDLECTVQNNNLYLALKNLKGLYDRFRVLELRKNKTLSSDESSFDYTLILVREKQQ